MTTSGIQRSSLGRRMLNKVPEVTIYFWIIKVLCTTVGETAADYMNVDLGFGLKGTTVFMGVVLLISLAFQFATKRYRPGVYWLAVVVISIFGTLITDNLVDNYAVALETTTIVFSIALAVTFAVWYVFERTLSIHTIFTTRREAFYWLAVLFTFALGTAAGDLMSERLQLGYTTRPRHLRRDDRGRRRRALRVQAERDPLVLAGVHPYQAARCVPRRPDVAATCRRGHGTRDHEDELRLPGG